MQTKILGKKTLLGANGMIIANLASHADRGQQLRTTVATIAPQVEQLNICLNGHGRIPDWLAVYPQVHAVIPDEDLGDAGRFLFDAKPGDDVFLLKDHITYPADYVARTQARRDSVVAYLYEDCVVGYHGTIYTKAGPADLIRDLLKHGKMRIPRTGRTRIEHPAEEALYLPRIVAELDTGAVLMRGDTMPDLDLMIGAGAMADMRFARWCHDLCITQVALPRLADWLPRQTMRNDPPFSRQLVDELHRFAFTVPSLGTFIDDPRDNLGS